MTLLTVTSLFYLFKYTFLKSSCLTLSYTKFQFPSFNCSKVMNILLYDVSRRNDFIVTSFFYFKHAKAIVLLYEGEVENTFRFPRALKAQSLQD